MLLGCRNSRRCTLFCLCSPSALVAMMSRVRRDRQRRGVFRRSVDFLLSTPWCLETILPGRWDSRPFAQLPRPDPRAGLVSRDTRSRPLSDGNGGADAVGRALARQPRVRVVSVSVKTVSADRSLQGERKELRGPCRTQPVGKGLLFSPASCSPGAVVSCLKPPPSAWIVFRLWSAVPEGACTPHCPFMSRCSVSVPEKPRGVPPRSSSSRWSQTSDWERLSLCGVRGLLCRSRGEFKLG
nr:uncharacterized protein LOC123567177 [Macaca fascicularis]